MPSKRTQDLSFSPQCITIRAAHLSRRATTWERFVSTRGREVVALIQEGLKRTGGYCPCRRERKEEYRCICEEFKAQIRDPNFEGLLPLPPVLQGKISGLARRIKMSENGRFLENLPFSFELFGFFPAQALQQQADQTVCALVDDPAERVAQLAARIVRHPRQLGGEAVADQLEDGFSENVALPELLGVALVFAQQIVDQLLRLLLVADDRTDLGADVPRGADGSTARWP